MMLSLSLRPTLELLCTCCEQAITGKAADDDRQLSAFAGVMLGDKGAKKYAVCPKCLRPVDRSGWTPQYKRRWTLAYKKVQAKYVQSDSR